MYVKSNRDAGTVSITASTAEEGRVLDRALLKLPENKLFKYDGCERDRETDLVTSVKFYVGGGTKKVTTHEGRVTIETTKKIGGVKLELRGTTEEDCQEIGYLRDVCFYGTSALIFLEKTSQFGSVTIVCTGKYCKLCNAPMITRSRCEWSTCQACADRCQHVWTRGAVHGGKYGDIGVGFFCDLCGIVKPESADNPEPPLSQFERHQQVTEELGILIISKEVIDILI